MKVLQFTAVTLPLFPVYNYASMPTRESLQNGPTYDHTLYEIRADCGAWWCIGRMPFDRKVAGSNPALAATYRDLGQVLHLQLPAALRRVNSDTVSIAVVGNVSERLMQ